MSLTDINHYMPENLAKAIVNPLFPALDSQLRAGRHVSSDDLDNHAFLSDFEPELALFYQRYNTELVRAPEGFFYLRPRSTSLINRSVLSELDMLVGKVLCFLYLSPERLAHEGLFTYQELYEELLSLTDEKKLMKLATNRAQGSDLDKEKLFEKVRTSLRRLRRLGMIIHLGETTKFRITEAVFRFGADVRIGDDLRQAQLRLIRDGEAVVHSQEPSQQSLLDTVSADEQHEDQPTLWEDEA
ncbi:chromosome partition protein MukE [Vibrio metschnikovii]|jgi:chromosome partition protein MukE|uniref:Chromosome partition protein MukE n=5 Tax=Bacteria TaxID=2 RepID=A0A9X0UMK8_VIBME|nr:MULTISPECIES: chromosome partition protein MukE [Vibrio]EEX36997.1 chromosome partition protein MukE [Vibrio metschnikovii CIP 69.14]EKO3563885.1 chromosome partition protein MukE [Vibrio metschnikovii]EKO3572508.1 chromosome partition protein MukE [Vibrio metschnikovii]EKO3573904.1 chromosome partition protein MukE [Vibrio metschnikovii]EKO3580470.1 chromosome partition protein MukE [Vibrio metschnikovii]